MIAKSGNYTDAIDAADRRIGVLQSLRKDQNCEVVSTKKQNAAALKLSEELTKLNDLYKTDALTKEECKVAKQKVLNSVSY